MLDGEAFFVQLGGQVYVAPGDSPEDAQCTARTTRKKRCGNTLDHGQVNGFTWLRVPGGYVEGFDFDFTGRLTKRGRRYIEQRCELHFDASAPSEVEPEWELSDPAQYQSRIVTADDALTRITGRRVGRRPPRRRRPQPSTRTTAPRTRAAPGEQPPALDRRARHAAARHLARGLPNLSRAGTAR